MTLDGQKIRGTTPSNHLGMVKELDVQVGMIIKALKAKGEYDNTVFLFTSDNGGLLVKPTIESGHNSPDIYRGGKNQSFEGGHRVPFIVSWPGRVPAGALTDHLVSGTDIMATLAKITGQSLAAHQAMDSYDFLATITGAADPAPREYLMIQGGTDNKVIYRDGKYKLIMQAGRKETDAIKPVSLFDLDQNVEEKPSGDLINQPAHRERVSSMLARYKAIRRGKLRTSRGVNEG